ncbi:MAG TPA: hypothetical protein VGT99_07670 [Gammaproteobacteria bacterium]|nr:hypothetical protein [Gammaproteobacteria bacterium]
MRYLAASLAVLAYVSLETYAGEPLTLEAPAKSLDPLINNVLTCGDWSFQGKHGSYRIISGWLWDHSEIYVQWLTDAEWDKNKVKGSQEVGVPQILATASFGDFDFYESATDLSNISCSKKQGQWVIEAQADEGQLKPGDPKAKYLISIELSAEPGKYVLHKRPLGSNK